MKKIRKYKMYHRTKKTMIHFDHDLNSKANVMFYVASQEVLKGEGP